jgi:hypothetical protein
LIKVTAYNGQASPDVTTHQWCLAAASPDSRPAVDVPELLDSGSQVHVSHPWALVQIRDGLAVLECAGEYDVSLLLEPAAPTPFDVVLDSLVPLVATDADTEVRSADAVGEAQSSAPLAAAKQETAEPQPSPAIGTNGAADEKDAKKGPSKEAIRAELAAQGFTDATFEDPQLRWRWRLVNVALRAGSGGGRRMTPAQLTFLRAELDFRMLHVRLAAIVRHCLRALRRSALVPDAADGAGPAANGDVVMADVKGNDTGAGPSKAPAGGPAVGQASDGSTVGSAAGMAQQVRAPVHVQKRSSRHRQ